MQLTCLRLPPIGNNTLSEHKGREKTLAVSEKSIRGLETNGMRIVVPTGRKKEARKIQLSTPLLSPGPLLK